MSKNIKLFDNITKRIHAIATDFWTSDEFAEYFDDEKYSICRDDTLCGCCAIASGMLMYALQLNGHEPVFNITDCHAFITVGKYILDPTFSQFNFGHPYIAMAKSSFDKEFGYNGTITRAFGFNSEVNKFTSIEAAIAHQKLAGWPSDQTIPNNVRELVTRSGAW